MSKKKPNSILEIDGKKLTDKEQLFVEHLCSGKDMSYREAARRAGYQGHSVLNAHLIAKKPHIQEACKIWRENRARQFYISESQIMERMWQEANYYDQGATHAGRIQALVWLGKHLGMFAEKPKEKAVEKGNTYNIIQYNTTPKEVEIKEEKVVKAIEEHKEEVLEAVSNEDIQVITY